MTVLEFKHGFEYPDNSDITLSDVAATLLAHERLLPVVTDILEQLVPGLTVEKATIYLDELHSGSLSEAFFVAIFVAFQEDLEREVPDLLNQIPGVEISDRYDTIVTVLFVVALYAGFKMLMGRTKKTEGAPQPTIQVEGDYIEYLDITAKHFNVSRDTVVRAVGRAIGTKRSPMVVRAAIDLFRPAKRGTNGRIIPLGLPPISRDTVADFPTDVAFAEFERDTVPISIRAGELSVRATDRDKHDKGWAGKIEFDGAVTRRLPLVLAPGVDPDELAAMERAYVEAVLENKVSEDGRTKPYRIHVMRILD